jgi:hypothetical protein
VSTALRVLTSLALVGTACSSDVERPEDAAPAEADSGASRVNTQPAPSGDARAEDALNCEGLRELGQHDLTDAGLVALLCPQLRATARELRAGLNLVDREVASRELLAQESEASPTELEELESLARLATLPPTRFAAPADPPPALPPAESAVLSPISPAVLETLAHASRRLTVGGIGPRERLDARALAARSYIEALRAIGLNPGEPLSPLARRLAGPALAHGLAFCRGYWSLGGRRLNSRAREAEMALLDIVRAVDRTAPDQLDAQLTDAHHRTWRYLQERDVRRRIDQALTRREKRAMGFGGEAAVHGVESLAPFPHQLERLMISGLADLALAEALRMANNASAYGIDPVEAHLLALLGEHGFSEAEARARHEFERLRKRRNPPNALGPTPYELDTPTRWPSLQSLQSELATWVDLTRRSEGLARTRAVARARLLLDRRPDLRAASGELPVQLQESTTRESDPDHDTSQRRAFALERGLSEN